MKKFFLLLTVMTLTACASSSPAPETNTYLLRPDVTPVQGEQTAPMDIGIGRIALASYLAGAGIVVRTEGDRVRSARQHIWAEPLDTALKVYLRDTISAELGYAVSLDSGVRQSWDYRIDIYVDQMHGGMDGEAVLDASWKVIDVETSAALTAQRFAQTTQQSGTGYDALVEAQKALLNQLAAAIASSVEQM